MKYLAFLLFLGLLSIAAATDFVLSPELKSLNPNLATCTPVAEWQPTCVYDNTLGSNSVEMWYDGKQDIWQIQQDGFGKEQHFKERPVDFFVATFGNNVLIPSRSKVRISYKAAPGWKVAIQQLHFTCGPLLLKAPHMTMATYEEKLSGIRLTLAKFYNESEDKDGLASSSGPSLMEVYLEYAPILIAVAVLGFFY